MAISAFHHHDPKVAGSNPSPATILEPCNCAGRLTSLTRPLRGGPATYGRNRVSLRPQNLCEPICAVDSGFSSVYYRCLAMFLTALTRAERVLTI
jgi:hypothetical protein